MRAIVEQAGLAGRVVVDSAGIGGWHVGDDMDSRSAEALTQRGYDASGHRARKWSAYDFDDRDLILAMDRGHLRDLLMMAPDDTQRSKVRLFRSYEVVGSSAVLDEDVPDPYYGGESGFTDVLDLIEASCRAILAEVRSAL